MRGLDLMMASRMAFCSGVHSSSEGPAYRATNSLDVFLCFLGELLPLSAAVALRFSETMEDTDTTARRYQNKGRFILE